MPLSLTRRNTPKTQGLELVAWEVPFMSVPTLKPWQGTAPEPAPALCCHPTFPPPALFLNIASPSESPPWRNEPKFNFGFTQIKKQSICLLPQPPSISSFWGCRSLSDVPEVMLRSGLGADAAGAKTDVVWYLQLPATWCSNSCNVLATDTVSSSTSKLPLCFQNHG